MDKDEALKLALSALFSYEDDYVDDGTGGITSSFCYDKDAVNKAIAACRQALAQPVQELDYEALFNQMCERCDILDKALVEYERVAQPAVQLTDEQIDAAVKAWFENDISAGRQPFGKRMRAAIKAAHGIKEKNT
jgi:hypothetical protein